MRSTGSSCWVAGLALAMWCGLEFHPVFGRLVDALDRHLGAEGANMMRGPLRRAGSPGELQTI